MVFGDADPYAGALDVVGHELSHGVTQYSANLVYQNQAGALNEAFSDIFGEAVEARSAGGPDCSRVASSVRRSRTMPTRPPSSSSAAVPTRRSSASTLTRTTRYSATSRARQRRRPHQQRHHQSCVLFARRGHGRCTRHRGCRADLLPGPHHAFACQLTVHRCAAGMCERCGGTVRKGLTTGAADRAGVRCGGNLRWTSTPPPPEFPAVAGPDSTLYATRDFASGALVLGRREQVLGDGPDGAPLGLAPVAASRPSVVGDAVWPCTSTTASTCVSLQRTAAGRRSASACPVRSTPWRLRRTAYGWALSAHGHR